MTRAAVRRQVTVVRAAARGAKFPFSSRGPPKKRKSPLIRADFRQYFLHNLVQPEKISRPQARNDLDRFLSRQKVNCRKAAREAALGRVRQDLHFSLRKRARLRRVRCRGAQKAKTKAPLSGAFVLSIIVRWCNDTGTSRPRRGCRKHTGRTSWRWCRW